MTSAVSVTRMPKISQSTRYYNTIEQFSAGGGVIYQAKHTRVRCDLSSGDEGFLGGGLPMAGKAGIIPTGKRSACGLLKVSRDQQE